MKFTKEEKPDIGRRVCSHELTMSVTSKAYGCSIASINNCTRLYRMENGHLPIQKQRVAIDIYTYFNMYISRYVKRRID